MRVSGPFEIGSPGGLSEGHPLIGRHGVSRQDVTWLDDATSGKNLHRLSRLGYNDP